MVEYNAQNVILFLKKKHVEFVKQSPKSCALESGQEIEAAKRSPAQAHSLTHTHTAQQLAIFKYNKILDYAKAARRERTISDTHVLEP